MTDPGPLTAEQERIIATLHEHECAEGGRHPWTEHLPWDGDEDKADAIALADRLIDAARASDTTLREAGEGYEVRQWVSHQPSGVVVLVGHPQLGGRYCKTDGGDWPCATVRAAHASPEAPRHD